MLDLLFVTTYSHCYIQNVEIKHGGTTDPDDVARLRGPCGGRSYLVFVWKNDLSPFLSLTAAFWMDSVPFHFQRLSSALYCRTLHLSKLDIGSPERWQKCRKELARFSVDGIIWNARRVSSQRLCGYRLVFPSSITMELDTFFRFSLGILVRFSPLVCVFWAIVSHMTRACVGSMASVHGEDWTEWFALVSGEWVSCTSDWRTKSGNWMVCYSFLLSS